MCISRVCWGGPPFVKGAKKKKENHDLSACLGIDETGSC